MCISHDHSPQTAHSVCGVCISLNKPAFTLLCLALEFFPVRSQGPSLGGQSQQLTQDLGRDPPLVPHFFHTTDLGNKCWWSNGSKGHGPS